MNLRWLPMTAVMLSVVCGPAYPEEPKGKKMELDDVVVTATRTERPTEEIPAGVSVVTREEIEDTRMFNLSEPLKGLPGVLSESKNGGYDTRLIIRGAGLKARYGVREIMVLLDGVPITDPDGMTRLDFVDTELVERIDVVKGPNSTLYGANAAGGVVNVITKSLFEEKKSAKAGYGNYNTQLYNGIFGTRFGETYVSVTGSRRATDSWREWNNFSTNQGGFRVGHLFSDKSYVEANVSLTQAKMQLPGTLTKTQFDNDISQLTTEPWRNMGRYSDIVYTSLKGEKEIGNVKLKPMAYVQWWQHYHPVTGLINDGGASVYGADIQADIKHSLAGMEGILTTGIAGQIDDTDGEKYTYRDFTSAPTGRLLFTTSDQKGSLAEQGNDRVTKWGVYAQESLRPTQRWIVDLGIRYDRVGFDLDTEQFTEFNYATGRYVANRQTIKTDTTFEHVSPRIGVVCMLTPALNLYGNISTGFQTPQTSELGENQNLVPSETTNYETGLKARFEGGHSADLSLFYITVEDDIVQTTLPGNQTSYTNAGETRKMGLELAARVQAWPGLYLGGAYTYSDFKFVEFNEVIGGVNFSRDGNRLPYVPMHQYSLFVQYKHPSGLRFKVETNTWGKYEVDNANSETYEGYALITNALVGYQWKGWDFAFDVYNVFDTHHAIEVTKESGGATKYRPGGPTTWMARVGYTF